MSEPSRLHLTEERIRAVVRGYPEFMKNAQSKAGRTMLSAPSRLPDIMAGETLVNVVGDQLDAVAGAGTGAYLADLTRLQWLLGVLAKGTVDDAVAALERQFRYAEANGIGAAFLGQMRSSQQIYVAQLRAIPRSEIDAVMACLDEVVPVLPMLAKEVQIRHRRIDDDKLRQAAAALRAVDPSRPQLTKERINRILEILAALVPGPPKLIATLSEGADFPPGKTPADSFPRMTLKKIQALGEEPAAFARDFFWLHLISNAIKAGESIDDRILEDLPRNHAELWIEVALMPESPKRDERLAPMMWRRLELFRVVGRDEEGAIKSMLPEIHERLRSIKAVQIAANRRRDAAKA